MFVTGSEITVQVEAIRVRLSFFRLVLLTCEKRELRKTVSFAFFFYRNWASSPLKCLLRVEADRCWAKRRCTKRLKRSHTHEVSYPKDDVTDMTYAASGHGVFHNKGLFLFVDCHIVNIAFVLFPPVGTVTNIPFLL